MTGMAGQPSNGWPAGDFGNPIQADYPAYPPPGAKAHTQMLTYDPQEPEPNTCIFCQRRFRQGQPRGGRDARSPEHFDPWSRRRAAQGSGARDAPLVLRRPFLLNTPYCKFQMNAFCPSATIPVPIAIPLGRDGMAGTAQKQKSGPAGAGRGPDRSEPLTWGGVLLWLVLLLLLHWLVGDVS